MKTYETIEQSLGAKKAVVISIVDFEHKGINRKMIKARKSNGKKTYSVVLYENGLYSDAV